VKADGGPVFVRSFQRCMVTIRPALAAHADVSARWLLPLFSST